MQTRKRPRTLKEAFGPYTSSEFVEPKRAMDWQDRVVGIASIIMGIALVVILLCGVVQ